MKRMFEWFFLRRKKKKWIEAISGIIGYTANILKQKHEYDYANKYADETLQQRHPEASAEKKERWKLGSMIRGFRIQERIEEQRELLVTAEKMSEEIGREMKNKIITEKKNEIHALGKEIKRILLAQNLQLRNQDWKKQAEYRSEEISKYKKWFEALEKISEELKL